MSKVRSKDGYNRMEEWWRTFVKECETSQSPPKKSLNYNYPRNNHINININISTINNNTTISHVE